ncbi:glycoprotein 3-alpha-L-fucosyltransferase A-like [Clytia hemisphaerica]|uniref:glycoprotein 3-alpha-L-fucosyltransferase A-like n=1 Tax=Clytia hemisphaerica TaxID=252671 RepID=UPI0034D5E3E8
MARLSLKRCMIGFTLILCFWLVWKVKYKNQGFMKYLPKVNFSSVVTPYEYQMKGDFLPPHLRKQKLILFFTSHFYSDIWKGLGPDVLPGYTQNAHCNIKECSMTYDKKRINEADLVIFHGVDFEYKNYTDKHFQAMLKKKPSHQRWVFWMHETPVYYPEPGNYDNLFNWTMTFSQGSDIYHPYYSYRRLTADDDRPGKYMNYALGRTKKIAWMVSHCGMTRGEYVMELQKYTDVTVYGLCGASYDNMAGICSRVESECMDQLNQYRFYLAFENSFCEDYVTEKYYKFGIMYGAVPIVMGARYNALNSIPGSYIDASTFPSVQALGEYINFLSENDYYYNQYFEWKNHFKMDDGIDKICLLCHAAHDVTRKSSFHKHFHAFWSKQAMCDPYEPVIQKFGHQIEQSKLSRIGEGTKS